MRDENMIVRERQQAIRREMDRRGISLKQVQFDGGWETVSTVASYFPQEGGKDPATMSVAALFRLLTTKALPAELLSLLLPDDFAIVQIPSAIDHDDVERACRDFLATKGEAHHPDSPAGRDIADCEGRTLDCKVIQLRGKVA